MAAAAGARGALLLLALLTGGTAPLEAIFNAPRPPPPPPSPPGTACSGEQIFTASTGAMTLSFGPDGGSTPLKCAFLLHTAEAGLTVNFTALNFTSGGAVACNPEDAYIDVFDGTTTMAKMLAEYSCASSWAVGSHTGSMLLRLHAAAGVTGTVDLHWRPS